MPLTNEQLLERINKTEDTLLQGLEELTAVAGVMVSELDIYKAEVIITYRAQKDEGEALCKALERTLSWLTSYPGGGPMGPTGSYEQARAAIEAWRKRT